MKNKPNEVVAVLADFFNDYLPNTKGLSENTITSYQYAFRLLFEYLGNIKHLNPDKVTFQILSNGIIEEFLMYLETQRSCSVKTRNIRRAAIVAFSKYAVKKAFSTALPFYSAMLGIVKKKESKCSPIKYFTKEEIALLLKLPCIYKLIGQRDVTMLAMLYATGARAQGLCDITLKDITLASSTFPTKVQLTEKGSKTRVVTIPDACTAILQNYLHSKKYDVKDKTTQNRHLFSSQTNEHMSIACVESVVSKYVALAKELYPDHFKQAKYTPHSFRHSIAVHMLESGESLVAIKAFLGHVSITSTTIYAQVTPELANKYLDERGKVLEIATSQLAPQSLPETLSFLYK